MTHDNHPTALEYRGPDDTLKGSERFNDLLKGELERLNTKIKTAEERARGNSTAVIGAAALVNLLRSPAQPLPEWALLLFGAGVIGSLALMVAILFNRNTTAISPEWMWKEHALLWNEDRAYLEIMQIYQRGTIRSIAELEQLERAKYRLLDAQNVVVAGTLLVLVALLLSALK